MGNCNSPIVGSTDGSTTRNFQQHEMVVNRVPPVSLSDDIDSSSFVSAVLAEHNRLRARHSASPLTLNPVLNRYAQEWATNLASRNIMQHRSNNRYGENLYACSGIRNLAGEQVVRSWYEEIKDYRFGESNPKNFSKVGHFTQVVWKNSTELGVGIATHGNSTFVVCNYDPPGNFNARYSENVTQN